MPVLVLKRYISKQLFSSFRAFVRGRMQIHYLRLAIYGSISDNVESIILTVITFAESAFDSSTSRLLPESIAENWTQKNNKALLMWFVFIQHVFSAFSDYIL